MDASGLAGWFAAALLCIVLILVLRLVSAAVLWLLCLPLALLLSYLPLGMFFCLLLALLFSVLFIVSHLLGVERCSVSASSLRCSSRCPRIRVALFRSSRRWLIDRGSVSDFHHSLLGCGSFCTSLSPLALQLWLLSLILFRDTLWYFTVSWMPRLHLQHRYSALRPS